jgi:hypothetical protein
VHALRAGSRHVELLRHLCRDGPEGAQLAGNYESRYEFRCPHLQLNVYRDVNQSTNTVYCDMADFAQHTHLSFKT